MGKVVGIQSSLRKRREHALFDSLSGVMLQGVLDEIREVSDFETEVVRLDELTLKTCRGCFSDVETRCHFLCDCYDDDFAWAAGKMIDADGIVLATPTYMFGVSSTLKVFLERWISFKAPVVARTSATKSLDECFAVLEGLEAGTVQARNPLQGKVGGIVVAGSELGQSGVIRELLLIMNLYGFVLPPQCFIHHTGHSMQSMEDVRESFYENRWLLEATRRMARSMAEMVRLVEGKQWPRMPDVLRQP